MYNYVYFFRRLLIFAGCLRFKTLKKLDLSLLFRRIIAKNIRVGFNYWGNIEKKEFLFILPLHGKIFKN